MVLPYAAGADVLEWEAEAVDSPTDLFIQRIVFQFETHTRYVYFQSGINIISQKFYSVDHVQARHVCWALKEGLVVCRRDRKSWQGRRRAQVIWGGQSLLLFQEVLNSRNWLKDLRVEASVGLLATKYHHVYTCYYG